MLAGADDGTKYQDSSGTGDIWTDRAGYNIMLSMNNYNWYYHLISASRAGTSYERITKSLDHSAIRVMSALTLNAKDDFLITGVCPRTLNLTKCALLNCGAYSLAQMFHYNGRPLPAAVLIRQDGKPD
jgi:hypothetical protein